MQSVKVLGGHHTLTAERFEVTPERMDLHYRIEPPLPQSLTEDDDGPHVYFWMEAADNAGNEYTEGGGAYGPSEDEKATIGSMCVQPGPYLNATSVDLKITFWDGSSEETHTFTFPVA